MKTQMRFQKILMIVTLIIGAFGVVYGLIFCSGVFNQLCQLKLMDDNTKAFFSEVQAANDSLFTLGIVLVVISVLPFIAACQRRRNYYITNYIAIGIVVAFQLVYIILLIVNITNTMQAFNAVDLAKAEESFEYYNFSDQYGDFETYPWTVAVGYTLIVLIALDAVALVLNVVWKIKLMQGEKALLKQGVAKEVI